MKCPTCISVDLSMSERKNVEIDFCPKCRGVWLERGELDKIIELSAVDATPVRTHATSPHGGYSPHKKKKSLLGELLDF
jgi:Zn-finger nucleic acid-binding protein